MTVSKVKTAVIPVAGLGTRFLPITKSVPKELLPILNRPTLHHICDEIADAGIRQVILVSSPTKGALEDYIRPHRALRAHLKKAGKDDLLLGWRGTVGKLHFDIVYQNRPLGLGHAVLQARDAVGDSPFALLLPDEVFFREPGNRGSLEALVRLHEKQRPLATIAVQEVPREEVSRYGIVEPEGKLSPGRPFRIRGMVEKPAPASAPSRLAIVGRYVIDSAVFGHLRRTRPGPGGEIQLTDALARLCRDGEVLGTEIPGRRFDTGVPMGLVKANVYAAWREPAYRRELTALIRSFGRSEKKGG